MANIVQAAKWMKDGHKVRRKGFDESYAYKCPDMAGPSFLQKGEGYTTLANFSGTDLLADDWELVPKPPENSSAINEAVADYLNEHYTSDHSGRCALCGGTGILRPRHLTSSSTAYRGAWCPCLKGQERRLHSGLEYPV